MQVQTELSTEQALGRLQTEHFDVIISDMGRVEGPTEGYVLLQKLRAGGDTTPFIVFAGSDLESHRREAIARGAQGSTNSPSALFKLVTEAINQISTR